MKELRLAMVLSATVLLVACTPAEFSLPKGDLQNGAAVFDNLQCIACHSIQGVDDKGIVRSINVRLGGERTRVYTYQELLTSIINPSHKLAKGYPKDKISHQGKSKMRNYNDILSVTELIDLVTFLETKYTLKPVRRTEYPNFVVDSSL